MGRNEEIEQQLWELVYELLSNDEADALSKRIGSEPDVARAYATVKLKSELLGEAARFDDSDAVPFQVPQVERQPRDAGNRVQVYRVAKFVAAVAAIIVLSFISVPLWHTDQSSLDKRLTMVAADQDSKPPIRTVLTVATKLNREIANPIVAHTFDDHGNGISTDLQLKVYDTAGNLQLRQRAKSDDAGMVRVELSGAGLPSRARVEVAPIGRSGANVSASVDVVTTQNVTYLTNDKPVYQPGETVLYRSLTLSRFDATDIGETEMSFHVEDPQGQPVPQSTQETHTRHGVGDGRFAISDQAAGGKYAVVARQAGQEIRRDFFVRPYQLPRLKNRLRFAKDSYGPSDRVDAEFESERVDGTPGKDLKLTYRAFVDGEELGIESSEVVTDNEGKANLSFQLPAAIREGDGLLTVDVRDGESDETVAKPIRINLGQIEIDFFPEGGELVAGVANRVYFHAHDPLGKPVDANGVILDSSNREATQFETVHNGRGVFQLTPDANHQYAARVARPTGSTRNPPLPSVSSERHLTLDTGSGVFAAGQPVSVTLRASRAVGPIVLAAACRGAIVGLQRIEVADFEAAEQSGFIVPSEVPVAPEAAGVVRLTAYDYAFTPFRPIAERLVYCRPTKQLDIQVVDPPDSFQLGETAHLELQVRNEAGTPQAAVLGTSVVADEVLHFGNENGETLPTFFYLTSALQLPEQLEDANFYLGSEPESELALDLLLGTQGWRRVSAASVAQFAQTNRFLSGEKNLLAMDSSFAFQDNSVNDPLPQSIDVMIPVGNSNEVHVTPTVQPMRRSAREVPQLRWFVFAFGGIVLVLLTILALRQPRHRVMWAPMAGLAAACLLVGFFMTQVEAPRVGSEVAYAPATGADMEEGISLEAATSSPAAPDSESFSLESMEMSNDKNELLQSLGDRPMELQAAQVPMDDVADAAALENSPLAGGRAEKKDLGQLGANRPDLDRPELDRLERTAERGAFSEGQFLPMQRRPAQASKASPAPAAAALTVEPENRLREKLQENAQEALLGKGMPQRQVVTREYARLQEQLGDTRIQQGNETIYWEPLLITDSDGKAQASFEVPPTSGVFRFRATGHSPGRLGSVDARILVESP